MANRICKHAEFVSLDRINCCLPSLGGTQSKAFAQILWVIEDELDLMIMMFEGHYMNCFTTDLSLCEHQSKWSLVNNTAYC